MKANHNVKIALVLQNQNYEFLLLYK